MARPKPATWRDAAFQDGGILVAVSGGADSVYLLHWLVEQNLPKVELVVGHVNHGLRGSESDADEAFVRRLAARLHLPFKCVRLNPEETDEASLRRLRLSALCDMAASSDIFTIATAHHSQDIAEWFILSALRGSGPRGLGNAHEVTPIGFGFILIKPLLQHRRSEIIHWLEDHGESWREDSSNRSGRYRRNRIRNEVLPLLESISTGAGDSLADAARLCGSVADAYDRMARKVVEPCLLTSRPREKRAALMDLARLPHPIDDDLIPGVIQALAELTNTPDNFETWALRRSITEAAASLIRSGITEERQLAVGGLRVLLTSRYWMVHAQPTDHDAFMLHRRSLPFLFGVEHPCTLPIEGGEVRTHAGRISIQHGISRPASSLEVVVNLDAINGDLRLTRVDPEEEIAIRTGHKRVRDALVEERVPSAVRDDIWGIRDALSVIWIPGVRQDPRTRYEEGKPARLLRLVRA